MQPSIFNTHVPLADDQVFLMNTFSDAQVVVSSDVVALLDHLGAQSVTQSHACPDAGSSEVADSFTQEERSVLRGLHENGFVVDSRQSEREAMDLFFLEHRNASEELHATVLTTLQCNFACDYCMQGDHGEYNASVTKMSL